jgi:hypothetical protein
MPDVVAQMSFASRTSEGPSLSVAAMEIMEETDS